MAEGNACPTTTVCINEHKQPSSAQGSESTLRLKLRKPKPKKKVAWTTDTVDNEHMNKKKSKCCCVYEKPHSFGESSSDTDDECEHCRGHVEVKKKTPPENGAQCSSKDNVEHGDGCVLKT